MPGSGGEHRRASAPRHSHAAIPARRPAAARADVSRARRSTSHACSPTMARRARPRRARRSCRGPRRRLPPSPVAGRRCPSMTASATAATTMSGTRADLAPVSGGNHATGAHADGRIRERVDERLCEGSSRPSPDPAHGRRRPVVGPRARRSASRIHAVIGSVARGVRARSAPAPDTDDQDVLAPPRGGRGRRVAGVRPRAFGADASPPSSPQVLGRERGEEGCGRRFVLPPRRHQVGVGQPHQIGQSDPDCENVPLMAQVASRPRRRGPRAERDAAPGTSAAGNGRRAVEAAGDPACGRVIERTGPEGIVQAGLARRATRRGRSTAGAQRTIR